MAAVNISNIFGDSKQLNFILLHFWRPEVQNQIISKATLPPDALGENLFLSSSSF
jgi:hypothetical protein